jgi:group I intron endonuclease
MAVHILIGVVCLTGAYHLWSKLNSFFIGYLMGCVYCATNQINFKKYIGKTTKKLSDRKKDHFYLATNNSQCAFHRALRKYGFDSFLWTKLYDSDNEDELFVKEKEFIDKEKTFGTGYNMTSGGEGISGYKFTEEGKAKISLSHRKRFILDPCAGKKMSENANKLWGDPAYVEKKRKEASKQFKEYWKDPEYRENKIKSMKGEGNPASVKIINIDTGQQFVSIREAAIVFELSEATIRESLNRPTRTASGFRWVTAEFFKNKELLEKYNDEKNVERLVNCAKPVICKTTGEVFSSCGKAGEKYKRSHSAIARACKVPGAKCAQKEWGFLP